MTPSTAYSTNPIEDEALTRVFQEYHQRIQAERTAARVEAPGGRDGGQDQRMRAIGPETGRLLHSIVASLEKPRILEVGTSFGYSTLWLADAARRRGGNVITLEKHAYKSDHAQHMARRAGLEETITFEIADALEAIGKLEGVFDVVFIDLWKDLYVPTLQAVLPKLAAGAIIVADNILRPGSEEIRAYVRAVRAVPGMSSVTLPVGTGVEISILESKLSSVS